jgi:hypothetical protein
MTTNLFYRFLDLFSKSKAKYHDHVVSFPTDSEIVLSHGFKGDIVAFHTADSFYANEAARMVASAERLGLTVHTTAIESAGTWVRNAALKPTFLLEARRKFRGPLLYVDVDAVFHRDPWPVLAGYDCDVAVYREGDRLISATILLNDTPATLRLLEVWKERCDSNPDIWDQVVLQEILDQDQTLRTPLYKVKELSASFCWIFDRLSNPKGETVYIEQLQASRQATAGKTCRRNKKLERRRERIATIEKSLASSMRKDKAA